MLWKGQQNYGVATFGPVTAGLPTSGRLGRYCDRGSVQASSSNEEDEDVGVGVGGFNTQTIAQHS